jgi:hypothetical protein
MKSKNTLKSFRASIVRHASSTLVVLALAAPGFAQSKQQQSSSAAMLSALSTTSCQSTFTSGSGPSYLQFCVTANGNITEFQSPLGVEHIREGTYGEGYGICDYESSGLVRYYDWAGFGDSGNWLSPVISQPYGFNTFPLKIVRTTSDGIFTLTQVFSRVSGELIVKVAMTLRNNSGISRDFALVRYADIDANNAHGGDYNNEFDFGNDSAWGYNNGFNTAYGLMISTAPTKLPHFAFVQSSAGGPDPCSPSFATVPYYGDGSAGHDWNGTIAAFQSLSVTAEYKRF